MSLAFEDSVRLGDPLTDQQLQLLRLMCAGKRAKQIGCEMDISRSTVAYHRAILAKKTGAITDAQLGVWAVMSGMVEIEPKGAAE